MQNRLAIKQNLLGRIEQLKSDRPAFDASPIIDLGLKRTDVRDIETLTANLEKFAPFPNPLSYATQLLNGAWQLEYSNAREIRSLKSLPLGFLVGKIYQIIDTTTASFENKAWVEHKSGLLSGYVRITATFKPASITKEQLSQHKIEVDFKQRFIAITKIIGLKSKLLDPVKVFEARNPEGRVPSLDITYVDETMRIGRGGDGSLFILTRVADLA